MKIITHNGNFHADDVFGVAALLLFFVGEKKEPKIIRTRDSATIKTGDIVLDVGSEYDAERNRFDHHQIGGAGKRANDVPYASFGLIWKKFGAVIAGSGEAAELVDKNLVQFIDAADNGDGELKPFKADALPYSVKRAIDVFNPDWCDERQDFDGWFFQAVNFAAGILKREVEFVQAILESRQALEQAYKNSVDKRIIVLDKEYQWENLLNKYPEPLFVILPRLGEGDKIVWRLGAVRDDTKSFINRRDLPADWAGKRDEELVKVTGVSDALFCHNKRFVAYAKSKEGAIELAKKAL
ncbi:MAG: metal-dependent protein hydrolase [Parcubacteria group bacterium Gr01-1014_73]|nr:MAG: metal-dependent protein hydrolase [Parcubacteria group bacterium Gr01-1014_73]